MTQAMINNLDILNNAALTADCQTALLGMDISGICDDEINNFASILDKTLENQNFTLGDMKGTNLLGDMSEKVDNFKDILIQAAREVNMENSLDLTLARDITEIINQLKNAVHPVLTESNETDETNETINETEETAIYIEDDSSVNIKTDKDDENTSESELEKLPIFEQILTFINNTELNNTNNNVQSEFYESDTLTQKSMNNTILPKLTKQVEDVSTEKNSLNHESDIDIDNDILKELNIESVASEADMSEDGFMQNQQSPEEYSVKIMLNNHPDKFDINFEKPISTQNSVKSSELTSEKIIEQITKHMDSLKSNSKLNILLNPESLGKINIQIMNSKDGLSAQLTVTTNDARELLMKGIDGLKEALLTQGVSVDNISVKIAESEEAYNPDWTEQENSEGKNKGQEKQQREEKEKGLFEKTIAESLKQKNNNI